MFKKLLTLMMVFAIFTVQAHAAAADGLKTAYDELNYALNVEWDQKDKAFYTAQMKEFNNSLRDLQSQGLTNRDLINFARSQVVNHQAAQDIDAAFNMITLNNMSDNDASALMVETMKKTYRTGASWNGEADILLYAGLGLLLIAAALAAGSGYYGGSPYYEDTCYYDYYYGYTCY